MQFKYNENKMADKINSGRFDGNIDKWEQGAKKALDDDIDKSIEQLLQEVYEQHEKAQEYRIATKAGEFTKHVPIELQLLAEKKISCFRYKLSQESERQTNKIINLTWGLLGLTIALCFLTAALLYFEIKKDPGQLNEGKYFSSQFEQKKSDAQLIEKKPTSASDTIDNIKTEKK
jgi:hypothetical protein